MNTKEDAKRKIELWFLGVTPMRRQAVLNKMAEKQGFPAWLYQIAKDCHNTMLEDEARAAMLASQAEHDRLARELKAMRERSLAYNERPAEPLRSPANPEKTPAEIWNEKVRRMNRRFAIFAFVLLCAVGIYIRNTWDAGRFVTMLFIVVPIAIATFPRHSKPKLSDFFK